MSRDGLTDDHTNPSHRDTKHPNRVALSHAESSNLIPCMLKQNYIFPNSVRLTHSLVNVPRIGLLTPSFCCKQNGETTEGHIEDK